jgi:2-dehydro-3-deoxygluconokinase
MLSMPQGRAIDILALGEPLYEFAEEPDGRFRAGFGGDTSNVAIAAARLGAKSAYVTLLGADAFGDAFIDLWRREGVDAAAVKRHASAPTGVYVVTQGPQGHVFSYLRQGSAASRMTVGDVPRESVAAAKALHVSGISLAISASAREAVMTTARHARRAGTLVSLDTNLRLRLWPLAKARAAIHAAAAMGDILKTSLEDGHTLTGREDPQAIAHFYRDLGARVVVVTLGAQGVFVVWDDGSAQFAAHDVTSLDATGAGDCFTGAFLAELCRGAGIAEAARFANAAAALSTRAFGAVAGLPRRAEVEAFLAR